MDVRFVEEKYVDDINRLMRYCFNLSNDAPGWFTKEILGEHHTIGAFEEDNLGASLCAWPYHIWFNGKEVGMGGIGNVATFPEYRYKKCVGSLLVKSLEIMRKRDQIFSLLSPFSYSFYRKYGWEMGYHYKRYTFEMDDFKKFKTVYGSYHTLGEENIDEMDRVYRSFIHRYNGTVIRDRDIWKKILKDQDKGTIHRYGVYSDCGELEGYLFYNINDGIFHIKELVYSSLESKEALFRFIYLHNAQASKIQWMAPSDDNTLFIIDNPRKDVKMVQGMMIRVIDVKKVLKLYPFSTKDAISFSIKVDDPWAEWNDKTFKVDIGDSIIVEDDLDDRFDIRCSIQTFSQLMIGYIDMVEGAEMGKIQGDREVIERVGALFHKKPTYINDFF